VFDRADLIEALERRLGVRVVGHGSIESTMAAAAADPGPAPAVHLASAQTAGRGRHGRRWESPPGNLYATIRWPEDGGAFPPTLLGAVMLAWVRAVREAGGPEVRCKWPNDGMLGDAKWAGMIAIRQADRPGEIHLGLGANLVAAPPSAADPPAVDLRSRWPEWPGEEAVAGMLLVAAIEILRDGPPAVPARLVEWARFDAFVPGEPVSVEVAGRRHEGLYRGIDAEGLLCVEGQSGEARFATGDASRLRAF
jgi:BirA family biotin operon repressor/biotin-[acetyl-CoA-carboxylase] ligase